MYLSTWFAALVSYEIGALIGSEAVIISSFITSHFWIRLKAESNNFFHHSRYSRYSILYIYIYAYLDWLNFVPVFICVCSTANSGFRGALHSSLQTAVVSVSSCYLLFLVCFRQKFSIRVKLSAIFSSRPKQLSYRAWPRSKGLHGLTYPFLPIFCVIDIIPTNFANGSGYLSRRIGANP